MCCKYSPAVYLWSRLSNGLIGSEMEVKELIYVGFKLVVDGGA